MTPTAGPNADSRPHADAASNVAEDTRHMRRALALAAAELGRVWPNPSVGCVLVRAGAVVGEGATRPGGRPHAETVALAQAGPQAEGATAYVTLEPCSHWGRTPPCAEGLVAARIGRAVVALGDPDPRVDGRGIAMLRAAGIAVDAGLCAEEAAEVNAGFLMRVTRGRPLVALVADPAGAASADALLSGERTGGGLTLRLAIGPDGATEAFTAGDDLGAALRALGDRGLTRIAVVESDPLAPLLRATGLVDRVGLTLS